MKRFTDFFFALVALTCVFACSYQPSNYHQQGGARTVIGGSLDVVSGGELDVESGGALKIAGTQVSATATELNLLASADRAVKVEKQTLGNAGAAAGDILAWSPAAAVVVDRLVINLTTKATGAATLNCGVAANATTSSDTLIDGLDANAATGVFSNLSDAGTNGKMQAVMGSTQYVTCSEASGDTAGLAGSAYIYYYAQ